MKTMQHRQFAITVALLLISLIIFGVAFISLSYRYVYQDKQDTMKKDALYIADYTAVYAEQKTQLDSLYQSYVGHIAHITDCRITIANYDGSIVYASDGIQNFRYSGGVFLPYEIRESIVNYQEYAGMSAIGETEDVQFAVAVPVLVKGQPIGIVTVSTQVNRLTELWTDLGQIFLFLIVLVCIVAAVITSIITSKMTKPLEELSKAARKFGHGEFEQRVTGYEKRKDEIGELCRSFNTMADDLSRSEHARSEFVANISHELKTPMTTISGFADGILDGTIPKEDEEKYLQIISDETHRLSRLVRRMLELSRLDAQKELVGQEQFDITETLLQVLLGREDQINEKKLDVQTSLPDNPVKVWGDPDQITQVCYNLMDNAIKFAPERTPLFLGVKTANGKAYISIRNCGETIPADELPKLFDRFHKTDKSRSIDRDGVGLGLYIVKAIMDNHKEDISATSENGITTFTFTLTLA